jgi:hypothetical protein
MADLFDRLFPADASEKNISAHYFFSALVDYAAGETTRQQIIDWWTLDTDAQADLNALCDQIDAISGATNKMAWGTELHAVLMFVEAGAKYTTKAAFRTRLGL